ncbi:MAG: hypothetical protein Q9163_003193 [Psora crenata]
MGSSEDKQWASKYLLDPLTAPAPSEETGPGAYHFATSTPHRKPVPTTSVRSSTGSSARTEKTTPSVSVRSSNNPYRASAAASYPSPPLSASPRTERFPTYDGSHTPSNRLSAGQASTEIPTSTNGVSGSTTTGTINRSRRTSSLTQRHEGDQTHRPLDMLRASTKAANRSPHLRKTHHVGADTIDSLDNVAGGPYHHEGPYDATLLARNLSHKVAPVAAVSASNEETLKATPREKIQDSLEKHYPLDGVARVPPGVADRDGRIYQYQEGSDMMIDGQPEGGAYKRWPGVNYHPDDLKGKGEPSYSIERALKSHKSSHRRNVSDGNATGGIEMMANPRSANRPGMQHRPSSASDVGVKAADEGQGYSNWEGGLSRSQSAAGKLRKRIGSLRIRHRD